MKLSKEIRWLLILIALVLGVAAVLFDSGQRGAGQIRPGSTTPTPPVAAAPQHDIQSAESARIEPLRPPPTRRPLDEVANAFVPANRNPSVPQAAQPHAQIPPLPYRYAGQVETDGRKLVLLMRDQQTLIARTGDILEGMYRVDGIIPQGARLIYLPLNITQHALAAGAGAGHPIGLLLTAPEQAERGGVFQVEVGLSGGADPQSAQLHLSYDAESFQMLDIGASGSPALPVLSTSPGVINLGFDTAEQGRAVSSTPIRFLVIGGRPGAAEIALTVEAKDGEGKTIATNPPERRMVMMLQD